MDEKEIEILCENKDIEQLSEVLENFIEKNGSTQDFTMFEEKQINILWETLFKLLENDTISEIHPLCLTVLKVLSRDKENVNKIICEKYIHKLIEKTEYLTLLEVEDPSTILKNSSDLQTMAEAVKCLCNIAFVSDSGRSMCEASDLIKGLVIRLKIFKDETYREEVMPFDIKLLFILTILNDKTKFFVVLDLGGVDCLSDLLYNVVDLSINSTDNDESNYFIPYDIEDSEQLNAIEILKVQFNLFTRAGSEDPPPHGDDDVLSKLTTVLLSLLYAQPSTEEKLMELRSNIVNLLTVMPDNFYSILTPEEEGNTPIHYMDHNMHSLNAMLQFLEYQLNITETNRQYVNLAPVLLVLTKATYNRIQRKYLRSVVLPPLRDVSDPPECGNTLRNLLCRLLTTPITPVRDLVAGFLLILCKENVSRMVKYTGFGNAAGHLAQRGLLGPPEGRDYSSSSDSDTEEYLEAQALIDPVVGCTRPPRADPFEGMSEEQKEHEAMKLVDMFDKLVSEGIVRPARLGPDGKPEPLEHVLQLQESQFQEPQLQDSKLQEPQLQESKLQEPQLQESKLQEPQLQEPQLQESQLQESTPQESQLQESKPQESPELK